MEPVFDHPWNLTPREAVALQRRLAARVRRSPVRRFTAQSCLAAGLDISGGGRGSNRSAPLLAGVIVMRYPEGVIVESHAVRRPAPFPYIPGLLSFREIPLYVELLRHLRHRPDLLLCDGQGIAHPRRLGLASHLGVLFDIPAIGVAKSVLCGAFTEPAAARGALSELRDGPEIIGAVLRTRDRVRPLCVSIGHRVDLPTATECVLAMASRYRLPEPTRLADRWVGRLRRRVDPLPHGRSRQGPPRGW
jgi:deoxyribonuclease V